MGGALPEDGLKKVAKSRQLSERLEAHPELKKYVESMLDIAEDVTGSLKKADDTEIQVVDNMRKIGAVLLHDWAAHQEKTITAQHGFSRHKCTLTQLHLKNGENQRFSPFFK